MSTLEIIATEPFTGLPTRRSDRAGEPSVNSPQSPVESERLPNIARCVELIFAAEAELGALMQTIEQRFGRVTALKAADVWLSELTSPELPLIDESAELRRCTIVAIDQMVREGEITVVKLTSEANVGDHATPS